MDEPLEPVAVTAPLFLARMQASLGVITRQRRSFLEDKAASRELGMKSKNRLTCSRSCATAWTLGETSLEYRSHLNIPSGL